MIDSCRGIIIGGPDVQPRAEIKTEHFSTAAACDKGFEREGNNQDRVVLTSNLFAVIDGMGGCKDGEKAAELLAEELLRTPMNIPHAIECAQERMNWIADHAGACIMATRLYPLRAGIHCESYQAGDVRRIITHKRSILDWLFKRTPFESSLDEGIGNKVYNFISSHKNCPTHHETIVHPGQRIFLCSDGVTGNISIPEMLALVQGKTHTQALDIIWEITEDRMKKYKERRNQQLPAKKDNRSCIVIDIT
jgi:serine/threonine protein phosphatase PrpC